MPRKKFDYKDKLNELSQKAKIREHETKLVGFCTDTVVTPKRKSNDGTQYNTERTARQKNEMGYQIQNKSSHVPKTHYSKFTIYNINQLINSNFILMQYD